MSTEAIREDPVVTVDFHIGFGFCGNRGRGKFSKLPNCHHPKKETHQTQREGKAFPNTELLINYLYGTLYTGNLELSQKVPDPWQFCLDQGEAAQKCKLLVARPDLWLGSREPDMCK